MKPVPPKRRPLGVNSPACLRAVKAIATHGPLNNLEVPDRAHLSRDYWQNQVKPLLKRAGLIHQSGWARNHPGFYSPIWAAGPAPADLQLVRPEKMSSAQRCADWQRETGYREARKAARRLRRPPDPALRALLGI